VKRRLFAALVLFIGLAGLAAWLWWRRGRVPPPPSPARLEALRARRDALQLKLREVVIAQGEKSLADAPTADVMIGIPTAFTASVLEQVVAGLFGETTLTLRNLKVHHEGEVRAKVLLVKRRIGTYVLDVTIAQAKGVLEPGRPALVFGRNRVDVTLPVRLAEGQGQADLRFRWDSKGLAANVVCGDIDVSRAVSGRIVPEDYTLKGGFTIAASGDTIVLRPGFPDLAVRMFVDPSEEAWAVVDQVVKDQRKGCEIALTKVDLKEKLSSLLGRGFNVKVPPRIFKPVKLPAGVSRSLEVQGMTLALQVKPTGVLVAKDRLWYGADLSIASKRPSTR
jgi:hypothetical protein